MLTVPAPAKINLYLHVTGKRADGYHLLDSLVAFTTIGDQITLLPADAFSLSIEGPFAAGLSVTDNLVVKAARLVCERLDEVPRFTLTLTKNLPVGSGIGGGSADAAATVRALLHYYKKDAAIDDILLSLGADVPACYHSKPLRFSGIGEIIEPVTPFPETNILLINPGVSCATPGVFRVLRTVSKKENVALPLLSNQDALFRFLSETGNDLTDPAVSLIPAVEDVLSALENSGAVITRMSGSGATCFGLFEDETACQNAAAKIKAAHPRWWVAASVLQST